MHKVKIMKKQRIVFDLILIITSLQFLSIAQTLSNKENGSNFYPLSENDYWEYIDYEWGGIPWDTSGVSVGRDTIISGKFYHSVVKRYFKFPAYGNSYERIDSTGDIYSLDTTSGEEKLEYRLSDTTTSSYWLTEEGEIRFDTSYIDIVFGIERRLLPVLYFFIDDTLHASPYYGELLCEGIGLLSTLADGGVGSGLCGCCISGITYGNITSTEAINPLVTSSFLLEQNYPNPFNNSTVIRYNLNLSTQVNLIIYDLLGRQVSVLFSGIQPKGKYNITWTPQDLASGIYLCNLKNKTYSLIQKIIYLK